MFTEQNSFSGPWMRFICMTQLSTIYRVVKQFKDNGRQKITGKVYQTRSPVIFFAHFKVIKIFVTSSSERSSCLHFPKRAPSQSLCTVIPLSSEHYLKSVFFWSFTYLLSVNLCLPPPQMQAPGGPRLLSVMLLITSLAPAAVPGTQQLLDIFRETMVMPK